MGTVKSLAHLYSYNEYLLGAIDKGDPNRCEQLLAKKPELIRQPLTANSKVTALHRASFRGNLQLMTLFIQKYGADINLPTQLGQTPLIAATKRNRVAAMKYLLEKGADPNFRSKDDLNVIDYAILPGFYQPALMLYEKIQNKQLRSIAEYKMIAKQYRYRYVNYQVLLFELRELVPVQNVKDFLTLEKIILSDPVIDPRQTWKQWVVRNYKFQDPPLVERNELPQDLQPQNRRFGRVKYFFGKLTLSPLSQDISYKPQAQTQALGQMQEVTKTNLNRDHEIKTIS